METGATSGVGAPFARAPINGPEFGAPRGTEAFNALNAAMGRNGH
jgi:hypothetical protein